jgi:hypothetical protein
MGGGGGSRGGEGRRSDDNNPGGTSRRVLVYRYSSLGADQLRCSTPDKECTTITIAIAG